MGLDQAKKYCISAQYKLSKPDSLFTHLQRNSPFLFCQGHGLLCSFMPGCQGRALQFILLLPLLGFLQS